MKSLSIFSLMLLTIAACSPKCPQPMAPAPTPAPTNVASKAELTEEDLALFGSSCNDSCSERIPSVKFCSCMCRITVRNLRSLHINESQLSENMDKVMPSDADMWQCKKAAGRDTDL